MRLSQREEAWQTAENLILPHQLAVLQRRQPRLWVPKTCVAWADPLWEHGWFGQALSVGPAGLGSAGGGMIFGSWA